MATAYAPYSNAMRLGQGDVVEATNLSPSTSIKSGSIGNSGKGGGGFIDCDKFKEADINFLIYVKAISQPPSPPQQENIRFQRVKNLPQESFNRVFGDCFISGFLEGGEFTVLVSISIAEEVKAKEGEAAVRTQARIALTALTGREEADAARKAARKALAEKTEMTVNVNWSGGGRLKDEDTVWDIDSILRVAARFPDLVYKCPQRIAAVLSKYTSLRSFHEQMPGIVPLDYDNVVLYHTYLLEAYMEYKHIVKQLNLMLEDPSHYQEAPELPEETREDIKPIRLIHSELDDAKTYCRNQMLRIVKEVDNIAVHPELASSEDHVPPFMSSELFAAMIPRYKPTKPPQAVEVIDTPSPLHQAPLSSYPPAEQSYILSNSKLSKYFLLSPRIGSLHGPPFTSQLLSLPTQGFPTRINLHASDGLPRGFMFHYPPHSFAIGHTYTPPVASLSLSPEERVVKVDAESKLVWKEKARIVVWVRMTTNLGREAEAGNKLYQGTEPVRATWEGDGVKGCYGSFGDAVDAWGVIWGRV
ncbi:hypothetical protein K440DRAFT_662481 [Wilcoxina mikolae CBS 423.85]|nr:hypothetical protein K440DRAFT_662481 [Wilcoxina mikolae CBS 423.85]